MVVETDIRADILEWLDAAFTESGDLATATAQVADRIVKEGHADAFVRELGPEVLSYLWRQGNQANRRMAEEPGERRIDLEVVRKSILDQSYFDGTRMRRLGDFDQAACRQAQRWYHGQGEGNLRKAFMFSKLGDGLKGKKIVDAVFSDERVRGFLQEFRME